MVDIGWDEFFHGEDCVAWFTGEGEIAEKNWGGQRPFPIIMTSINLV